VEERTILIHNAWFLLPANLNDNDISVTFSLALKIAPLLRSLPTFLQLRKYSEHTIMPFVNGGSIIVKYRGRE